MESRSVVSRVLPHTRTAIDQMYATRWLHRDFMSCPIGLRAKRRNISLPLFPKVTTSEDFDAAY